MKRIRMQSLHKGQALVSLLFFMVVAMSVSSAAVVVILVNSRSTTRVEQGSNARILAESGAENAILRLLRDPSYSGETLEVGDGTASITVTGSDTKTITSDGALGSFTRTVRVTTELTNGILNITSWQEIF